MFKGLVTQSEIAEEQKLSLSSIRKYAMRPDFPPVERKIGPVKFYAGFAAKDFFRALNLRRKQRN